MFPNPQQHAPLTSALIPVDNTHTSFRKLQITMLVSFKAALVVATAAFSHAIAFDEVGVASIDGDAAEGHVRGFKVSSIATYDLTATSVGPDNANTYGGDDEYTDVEIGNEETGFDVEVDEDAQVRDFAIHHIVQITPIS
jgi:hypothetical protein